MDTGIYKSTNQRMNTEIHDKLTTWQDKKTVSFSESVQITHESKSWNALTRIEGGLQAIAGGAVLAMGTALDFSGIGALVGIPLGLSGSDNLVTGTKQLWTGHSQQSHFVSAASMFGVSKNVAENVQLAFDIVGPMGPSKVIPKILSGTVDSAVKSAQNIAQGLKSFGLFSGKVGGNVEVAQGKVVVAKTIKMIEEYMGTSMKITKPGVKGKSDLILTSADETKKIRFDIKNSHGLEPHVNIETYEPRNSFIGDKAMVKSENLHVFPKNNLENKNVAGFKR